MSSLQYGITTSQMNAMMCDQEKVIFPESLPFLGAECLKLFRAHSRDPVAVIAGTSANIRLGSGP